LWINKTICKVVVRTGSFWKDDLIEVAGTARFLVRALVIR
jgi:hypothetical protein